MVEEQIRYSDADLAEFKALIQAKLEKGSINLESFIREKILKNEKRQCNERKCVKK